MSAAPTGRIGFLRDKHQCESQQKCFHVFHPEKSKLMKDRCVSPGLRMLLGKFV